MHRKVKAGLKVALGIHTCLVLGMAVPALVWAKTYWGFLFLTPPIDQRAFMGTAVQTYSFIQTATHDDKTRWREPLLKDGHPYFQISKPAYFKRDATTKWPCRLSSYCTFERLFFKLDRLPSPPITFKAETLIDLYPLLEKTQLLIPPTEKHYANSARDLYGIAIRTQAPDNTTYLLVGIKAGEISNDHLPYYEFLFQEQYPLTSSKLLSSRMWFFDIAGLEGMEGPVIVLVTLALLAPPYLFVFCLQFLRRHRCNMHGKANP